MLRLTALFTLFSAIFFPAPGGAANTASGFVDTHVHLKGITPERAFPGPPVLKRDYPAAAAILVSLMDKIGVKRSIVLPPPQVPGQQASVAYADFLAAVGRYPDRLAWGAGGDILNPIIVNTPAEAMTQELREDFAAKARRIAQDGAKVFGEMGALHFSFSARHVFFQISPDHPLWMLLADIAAETGLPIDVHMEAVPRDQPTPPPLLARSAKNPTSIRANLPAFEKLLARNRHATIVWCHAGWDNTGHMTVELFRRLLTAHPNLYLSLKIVPPSAEPFRFTAHDVVGSDHKIRPEWAKLLRDFPDRFVVGSDEFVAAAGDVQRTGPPSFETTWRPLLNQLPPELAAKIGRENAERIYRLGK